jgi:hypothetical protein
MCTPQRTAAQYREACTYRPVLALHPRPPIKCLHHDSDTAQCSSTFLSRCVLTCAPHSAQRRRLQGTTGCSSKQNGTKHSEKGPSISSSNPGGQPPSDSAMYFNEALARSWHGVVDFLPNGTMDERSRCVALSCRFDAREVRLARHGGAALQCTAFQGDFHRVRCLPALGWVGCGRRLTL